MTKAPKPKSDFDVGYGKPPQHTRFPKGQSGNPGGAPKKKKAEPKPTINPAGYPTRNIIRNEAKRVVVIRDGDNRKEVSVSEAVMMAIANKAMTGSVFAQRTYLQVQMAEDERRRKELKEDFDFWSAMKREHRDAIDKVASEGREPPLVLPHPDDIILKYATYEVDIVGPFDEGEYKLKQRLAALRDIYLEISMYRNEDNILVPGDDDETKIGTAMMAYSVIELGMPPSFKHSFDAHNDHLMRMMMLPRHLWLKDLAARCAKLDMPLPENFSVKTKSPVYPIRQFGLTWRNGKIDFAEKEK